MAPSTPSPNPEAATESNTEMHDGDVEAIGAHCQYCRKLDFLPYQCQSCKGTFCGDHHTPTSHACTKAGSLPDNRTSSSTLLTSRVADERDCAEPSCKSKISLALTTGVRCTRCNRQYCLKHRMQEDHNCANLIPLGARPANGLQRHRDQGISALAKLKTWAAEQRAQKEAQSKEKKGFLGIGSKKSSAAAQALAATNELKRTAKGDAGVPQEKRVYLYVEASADTTRAKHPTGKFYYNKDWTVGRVLDMAAKALQVQNVNNRGGNGDEKLHVFHVEGGRLLLFNEKIGDPCASGNMVVLIRGLFETGQSKQDDTGLPKP
ncbi:AN1 zinc finger protein-like protein [Lophiostoma macrostomum CBS 122681]|uniref:AN1 zinc finger protein-like protein n=1 Tax=Lophiostoma macrostomum CBS 122681 TaxID=1314788 RepID=A0A6A6TA51_9PLEO|nr:AN1 zinc finger protein-like protein [Lophiostoma macrostomum CBS 122681]